MDILTSPPFLWFALACLLLAGEILFTTAALFFFAAAAAAAALSALLGFGLAAQLVVFSVGSFALLIFLRRRLKKWLTRADREVEDNFTGTQVLALSEIAPGRPGQVEMNGVSWRAESQAQVMAGKAALVVGQKGLTLIIAPLPSRE